MYDQAKADKFRKLCLEDQAHQLSEGVAWLEMKPLPQLELVERFLDELNHNSDRLRPTPFPELQMGFKNGFVPYVSRGVAELIEAGLESNPIADRDGYAHDLFHMSRACDGPESPIGWVPFVCILNNEPRALLTGMWCVENYQGVDRIIFCTVAEVMQSQRSKKPAKVR